MEYPGDHGEPSRDGRGGAGRTEVPTITRGDEGAPTENPTTTEKGRGGPRPPKGGHPRPPATPPLPQRLRYSSRLTSNTLRGPATTARLLAPVIICPLADSHPPVPPPGWGWGGKGRDRPPNINLTTHRNQIGVHPGTTTTFQAVQRLLFYRRFGPGPGGLRAPQEAGGPPEPSVRVWAPGKPTTNQTKKKPCEHKPLRDRPFRRPGGPTPKLRARVGRLGTD